MREPFDFGPPSDDVTAGIWAKITDRTLDYPDLENVIRVLGHNARHEVIISPYDNVPDFDANPFAANRDPHFDLACKAMHQRLMQGNLPTALAVKYPSALIDRSTSHGSVLGDAMAVTEMLTADNVVVYADSPAILNDARYKRLIGIAKGLGKPVEVAWLNPPKRASDRQRREQWINNIAPIKLEFPKLDEALIESTYEALREKTLGADDLALLVEYIHTGPRIVVESPFAPNGKRNYNDMTFDAQQETTLNMRFAFSAMRKQLDRGMMGSASHAEFTYKGILDDTDKHERVLGIAAGLAKTLHYDISKTYLQRDTSSGIEKGIEFAQRIGRDVYTADAEDWPKDFTIPGYMYEGRRHGFNLYNSFGYSELVMDLMYFDDGDDYLTDENLTGIASVLSRNALGGALSHVEAVGKDSNKTRLRDLLRRIKMPYDVAEAEAQQTLPGIEAEKPIWPTGWDARTLIDEHDAAWRHRQAIRDHNRKFPFREDNMRLDRKRAEAALVAAFPDERDRFQFLKDLICP
ncbi:MAG: hypothetical protein AB7G06_08500 [Bdellovibrionales bacterium]